jgi:tRNA dimethylallyltransferase
MIVSNWSACFVGDKASHGLATTRCKVFFLVGPTGVGKSGAALELARALKTEILCADSRQVYRGMDIGTAKPTSEERREIPHHLLDLVEPDERFSAGRFVREAEPILRRLLEKGRTPIVAGGTGLYIRALLHGLWEGPEADWELRGTLYEAERREGAGTLHRRLKEIDPEAARAIRPQDRAKLVRAIEVYEKTGWPISDHHREHRFSETPYEAVLIGLRRSRPDLYWRIESRVDQMIADGLIEEVRGLMGKGYSAELPAMKGLGYRQMIGYINGEYDRNEAVRRLKRDTKRYAKRQFTWFNRDPSIRWIDLRETEGAEAVYQKVRAVVEEKLRGVMDHAKS